MFSIHIIEAWFNIMSKPFFILSEEITTILYTDSHDENFIHPNLPIIFSYFTEMIVSNYFAFFIPFFLVKRTEETGRCIFPHYKNQTNAATNVFYNTFYIINMNKSKLILMKKLLSCCNIKYTPLMQYH